MYNVCYFLEGKFSRDTAHVFRTIQRGSIGFPCEVKRMMITKLIKYLYNNYITSKLCTCNV